MLKAACACAYAAFSYKFLPDYLLMREEYRFYLF